MSGEEREKRRAKFMADVSHDMKTPLNAVIGFTSVLLQDRQKLGADKARQLELVYKSAHRLLERVDALTEFFRLQAGDTGPRADWFAPRQLIEETFGQFRDDAGQKGIELRVGPGPIPSRLRTSSKLLSRILRELVSNAVKFTSAGSVCVDLRWAGGRVGVEVADTGSGMSAPSMERLSRSLRSADSYEGLGLGLALSREAARRLGGSIRADSRTDRGSTFTLFVEMSEDDVEE
jgi:signal transduction histidine kinase